MNQRRRPTVKILYVVRYAEGPSVPRAVDWCAYLGILFFILGLTCTMVFVAANFRKESQMSKDNTVEKVVKGEFGEALKPVRMTPLVEGRKPVAMTPIVSGENRGAKPVPMTPTKTPAQPGSGNTSKTGEQPKQ